MPDSPFDAVAITPVFASSLPDDDGCEPGGFDGRQARFYADQPALAGAFPHHNTRNQAILRRLEVSCENCHAPLPLEALHGVINDYMNCTEVRYLGQCVRCNAVAENVLRVTVGQMTYLRDGEWCTSVNRPWWHCLWPWPIDSDREW